MNEERAVEWSAWVVGEKPNCETVIFFEEISLRMVDEYETLGLTQQWLSGGKQRTDKVGRHAPREPSGYRNNVGRIACGG